MRTYNPATDAGLIARAYAYGARMHAGQYRHSGDPYFSHPVAVAAILSEQRLDDASIVTALLHDTIEDTKSTYADVAREFGEEIAELVDGVTKLTNLELTSTEAKQAENFRKLLMAMSRDLRVILVKLADRLHNMRTIKSMRADKQVQKARETMDIYAPLAGRMGMQWMREELEDLAFRVINPEARSSIIRRFLTLQKRIGRRHQQASPPTSAPNWTAPGSTPRCTDAPRSPIRSGARCRRRSSPSRACPTSTAFASSPRTRPTATARSASIHRRWRAVPGRFKDYISQPKSNGYRSIHTTVSGRDGKRVEVQIRSRQMHEVAESGVAAHWAYRDGTRAENPFAVDPAKWIERLTERFDEGGDSDEFLEHVKLEMYSDQVFCFTPKGDVVQLPRGATPLDFAYAIHTRIGNSCVSARVDGMRVPLWTRLKNGQSVEIITAEGQTPQATWIDLVVTGRAKSAIRRRLREEDRSRFVRLGQELARVAFDNVGKKATDKALTTAARRLGLRDGDEVLARIGAAELSARAVLAALYPELAQQPQEEVDRNRPVAGLSPGQAFQRADCCRPVPGRTDRRHHLSRPRRDRSRHRLPGARRPGRTAGTLDRPDLACRAPRAGTRGGAANVTISNDAGVLGRICTLIGEQKANISDLRFVDRKPDYYRLEVEVELRDVEHLHAVMTALEAENDVAELERVRDPGRRP